MRLARLLLAASAVAVLLGGRCGSVAAAPIARLEASFSPERLGAPTTISVGFTISTPIGVSPLVLTNVGVLLPSEMGIATSGLGLSNCVVAKLEEVGPKGCPSESRMGRGNAIAQVPIAGETVVESAQIEIFSAPVREGRLSLLVYAIARTPISAQLVFPATVLPASGLYGENIDTNVPLVESVPEGPDVAITSFHATLGPAPGPGRFLYYKSVGGKRVAYSPDGLILPPSCPQGGFPFKAEFSFQDHITAIARTTVPCRRLTQHQRRGRA